MACCADKKSWLFFLPKTKKASLKPAFF
jgi:hypothetical protein